MDGACVTSQSLRAWGVEVELPTYGADMDIFYFYKVCTYGTGHTIAYS